MDSISWFLNSALMLKEKKVEKEKAKENSKHKNGFDIIMKIP